ncbi:MAG: zf-HC2 domain-containing protein [Terriglobales bacterium]
MKCSEVERVLPELVDGSPAGVFPADFESHLQSCPACSDLVSDLKLIASEARDLAESEEPAPRVWVRIAAQLRDEGLIRDAESRPVLVPASPQRRWTSTAWWLAPVAAAVLVAGAYVVSHKPAPQVATHVSPPAVTTPVAQNSVQNSAQNPPDISSKPRVVASTAKPIPATHPPSPKSAKPTDVSASAAQPTVEPEASPEDQQFLSVVSTRAPSLRATYEGQLQRVNANIREVQAYLDRYPGDPDARQQLMDAYQQKALLYQIALDRIQ